MKLILLLRRRIVTVFMLLFLASCAVIANNNFDSIFGSALPQQRMVAVDSEQGQYYHDKVQPIIESRCVVCHGCYDAPCQLKLTAPAGIDRGANEEKIYNGTRLISAATTRLFVDYSNTGEWRKNEFYPVLNERNQTPVANKQAGVMARLLALKQQHPLPPGNILPEQFDFSLDREQQCPKASDMDNYAKNYALWGMPFGLPKLAKSEAQTLQNWLANGAKMAPLPPINPIYIEQVNLWEKFLNADTLKAQLVSRYLYEHWFNAHLYFSDLPEGEYFRVVRSYTPPGKPISIIRTRRPYDDPKVERVYYRLWRERETILEKTHMPYALNNDRLEKYTTLFIKSAYSVNSLPSYKPEIASNPFKAFEAIPTVVRYKFLLEEAQFTIMNFIKSPVCRGQVALNVINDHFWVFFVNPQQQNGQEDASFYSEKQDKLALPTAAESDAYILVNWLKYSKLQRAYMREKAIRMNDTYPNGAHITTKGIWDGDGYNSNAALTIFRHIDSATVIKGMVGQPPKTAWVIDYGLLERIHYLLAAGFDVYGNIGHQLNTRLYMDFLRIEGEFNFLALLPPEKRIEELKQWYQGVSERQRKYLMEPHNLFMQPSRVNYSTNNPKQELYQMLRKQLTDVLPTRHEITDAKVPTKHRKAFGKLQSMVGGPITFLPQITLLTVKGKHKSYQYTLLRNNAHTNITSLLNEEENRQPEKDTLTITNGIVGAYPDVFVQVSEAQLDNYIELVMAMRNEKDYTTLMDNYAIRRTNPNFWQHSDAVNAAHKKKNPFNSGLLDYNRLENR